VASLAQVSTIQQLLFESVLFILCVHLNSQSPSAWSKKTALYESDNRISPAQIASSASACICFTLYNDDALHALADVLQSPDANEFGLGNCSLWANGRGCAEQFCTKFSQKCVGGDCSDATYSGNRKSFQVEGCLGVLKVSGALRSEKDAGGECVMDCSAEGVEVAQAVVCQPELGCVSMHVVGAGAQQQHPQGGERARIDETAREPILAIAIASTHSAAAAASVALFTWGSPQSSSPAHSLPPSFAHLRNRSITHHVHTFPNEAAMLSAVCLQQPKPLLFQTQLNRTSSNRPSATFSLVTLT
jgi:hypothetical protein